MNSALSCHTLKNNQLSKIILYPPPPHKKICIIFFLKNETLSCLYTNVLYFYCSLEFCVSNFMPHSNVSIITKRYCLKLHKLYLIRFVLACFLLPLLFNGIESNTLLYLPSGKACGSKI